MTTHAAEPRAPQQFVSIVRTVWSGKAHQENGAKTRTNSEQRPN